MPSHVVQSMVLAFVFAPCVALAATGAGADDGAAESTVRLPKASEAMGPADSASTVKAPHSTIQPAKHNGFDELSVSAGTESYVSQPTKNGPNSFQEFSARARGKTQTSLITAAIDAGGSVAANASNYSNFEVPEAYVTLGTQSFATAPGRESVTKAASLTVGRKKERWSGLDSDWSLGLVQPFNKFDALRPTEQGLTGAFAEAQLGFLSVTAFGSSIFIPEQTAPYQLSNGNFSTSSPWFSIPPTRLNLLGQVRNAEYTIDMPSTQSVLNHGSYGFRLRASGESNEGFYAQGSFLRAPMNSITLGFTGQLSIVEGDSYGDVTVEPALVYHSVTSGDVGYAGRSVAVGFSVLNEVPDNPVLYDQLTTQHYEPMTMLSPSVELKTFPSTTWGPKVRVSYLQTNGGEMTAVGEYAQNGNVFGPRLMFRHAISTSVESTLHRSERWTLDTSARWVEELDELGTVLMSDVRLGLGDSWRIALQADLLGSRLATSNTDTFIARFRANDRAGVRVTYLF